MLMERVVGIPIGHYVWNMAMYELNNFYTSLYYDLNQQIKKKWSINLKKKL